MSLIAVSSRRIQCGNGYLAMLSQKAPAVLYSTSGSISHPETSSFIADSHKDFTESKVERGHVYFVATPLGNIQDVTIRAINVLRDVDLVCAEDTRQTVKLFRFLRIPHKELISHHEHNLAKAIPAIVMHAKNGKSIAVVSDAGTPGISDPGSQLAVALHKENIPVHPVPGCSAVTAALSVAGYPAVPFSFFGFLPARGGTGTNCEGGGSVNTGSRRHLLEKIIRCEHTVVFFEAPHRVRKTLQQLSDLGKQVYGDGSSDAARGAYFGEGSSRSCVCCRELTKKHEHIVRAPLDEILTLLQGTSFTDASGSVSASSSSASELDDDDDGDAAAASVVKQMHGAADSIGHAIPVKGEFTIVLGPVMPQIQLRKQLLRGSKLLRSGAGTLGAGASALQRGHGMVTGTEQGSTPAGASLSGSIGLEDPAYVGGGDDDDDDDDDNGHSSRGVADSAKIDEMRSTGSGSPAGALGDIEAELLDSLRQMRDGGKMRSAAVRAVSQDLQLPRSAVYAVALRMPWPRSSSSSSDKRRR